MKQYEYKIIVQAPEHSDKFLIELNEFAKKGFRFMHQISYDNGYYEVLLEREIKEDETK